LTAARVSGAEEEYCPATVLDIVHDTADIGQTSIAAGIVVAAVTLAAF